MDIPIQAIVCAVDFSPFCSSVCDCGVALAERSGIRLYLLHAVHHPQDRVHPTLVFERGGDLDHLMADASQRMHQLMQQTTVEWEPVVRFGDPVEQTMAVVDTLPPCLLVSASHGLSGFRRFFVGTVVERLSRMVNCPMLVVKSTAGNLHKQAGDFRSAAVSCDAHGYWHRLPPILNLLQPDPASSIHLVHALEGPVDMPSDEPTSAYAESQQILQDRLTRQLHRKARQLFPEDKPLTIQVAPGEPEELVLREAQAYGADLIVVGVRPSWRMGRLISGSTTEALLRHGPCSVLTVPEPKDH